MQSRMKHSKAEHSSPQGRGCVNNTASDWHSHSTHVMITSTSGYSSNECSSAADDIYCQLLSNLCTFSSSAVASFFHLMSGSSMLGATAPALLCVWPGKLVASLPVLPLLAAASSKTVLEPCHLAPATLPAMKSLMADQQYFSHSNTKGRFACDCTDHAHAKLMTDKCAQVSQAKHDPVTAASERCHAYYKGRNTKVKMWSLKTMRHASYQPLSIHIATVPAQDSGRQQVIHCKTPRCKVLLQETPASIHTNPEPMYYITACQSL